MKAIVFIHDDVPDRNGNQVDINGLSFPSSVPLRNFEGEPIGTANLKREGNQIVADLHPTIIFNPALNKKLFPAIGFKVIDSSTEQSSKGYVLKIAKAEINEISLCQNNADERIPPLDFMPVREG